MNMPARVSVLWAPSGPRYAEARQRNSSSVGRRFADQDVAGIDVAVHYPLVVGVVQGLRDRGHDLDNHPRRHAVGVAFAQQLGRVGAIDVLRREPQLVLELPSVGEAGDVRVPQRCSLIGLLVEPLSVVQIDGGFRRDQVKHHLAWKPRVLGHVELTELFVSELPDDIESGGCRSNDQRHGEMVQTSARKPGHPVQQVRMFA